jgi:hypothetical protein
MRIIPLIIAKNELLWKGSFFLHDSSPIDLSSQLTHAKIEPSIVGTPHLPMDPLRARQAWQKFSEKMRALRARQREILRNFSKKQEEQRIEKIRKELKD